MNTIIIDDKTVSVDGIKYVREEPKYIEGKWYIAYCSGIKYLIRFKRYLLNYAYQIEASDYIEFGTGNTAINGAFDYIERHATHSEIEQHLIKVAKEKGFKEGVRFIPLNKSEIRTLERFGNCFYSEPRDALFSCTPKSEWENGSSNPPIYEKGKWAEILPSKKPLPKTKAEFSIFLSEFEEKFMNNETVIKEFLEDYE